MFECDQCGACCTGPLGVTVGRTSARREPRLIPFLRPDRSTGALLGELCRDEHGRPRPCPFLDGDSRCSIHATKPLGCASFPAGHPNCQSARAARGIAPLEPC